MRRARGMRGAVHLPTDGRRVEKRIDLLRVLRLSEEVVDLH